MLDAFWSVSMSSKRGRSNRSLGQPTQKGEGTHMNFNDQRIWWIAGVVVVILII